ncbi:MAG: hypothetical protein D6748_02035 [Calditrichaeota bacterium]|nr:MAG: hypothetical protein D6748_02035 [Calditrichota bacterium]
MRIQFIYPFFLIGLLLFLTCQHKTAFEIKDNIPVVHLIAGEKDTLQLSDLFYAPDYSIEIEPVPGFFTSLLPGKKSLIIEPSDSSEGFFLIPFHLHQQDYAIPVMVEVLDRYTFTFKPDTPPEKITLFGSFNNWNRDMLPLKDEDGDGVYQVEVSLPPGRYEYKFFVDGEEFIDPTNPEKVSNPFGSYNSVLTVPPRHPETVFLHFKRMNMDEKGWSLIYVYEEEGFQGKLAIDDIKVLLNNTILKPGYIQAKGNQVMVNIPGSYLLGDGTLRITVSRQGKTTPLQTVQWVDGIPAGQSDSHFTWNEAIIYSLMIDRFLDGDSSNNRPVIQDSLSPKTNFMGGDLQGVLKKMREGYFDTLGVNVLWISPVIQNPDKAHREYPPPHHYVTGYHGYWPVHPTRVDDRFGTLELLKELIGEAHHRGIKVLLDFVAHHVYIEHPFYQEHPEWFGSLYLPDGRRNLRLWDEHRLTTWFEPFLPSFDYVHSDEAVEVMTDNALWWLQQAHLDGFRHDAVKHIPNRFWRVLTRKIKERIDYPEKRKTFQIGETFGSYDLIRSYVNNGQLDSQFNFNLFYTARYVFLTPDASFKILADELGKTHTVYGMNHLMGNIMDSHDQVRYMAYTDGDISLDEGNTAEIGWNHPPEVDHPESYRKAALYLAYLLTIPGIPTIYYGDEIGMTGASDPDNRRMMRFDDQLSDYEKEMFQMVKELIHIRRHHSALNYGDFLTLFADNNVFAYLRSDVNERILVVINKSQNPQTVQLKLPSVYQLQQATDLSSGEEFSVSDSELTITLAPVSWRVMHVTSEVN